MAVLKELQQKTFKLTYSNYMKSFKLDLQCVMHRRTRSHFVADLLVAALEVNSEQRARLRSGLDKREHEFRKSLNGTDHGKTMALQKDEARQSAGQGGLVPSSCVSELPQ